MSPVTRVVQLLTALSQKIEEEAKTEGELFGTYQCWAKSVVGQKQASNSAANSRVDALQTYITDLEAGRIDLTTERVDLQKEIAGLTIDIEQATAQREKEERDYESAKAEMEQAVDALTRALDVLRQGTGQTQLVAMKTSLRQKSYAAFVEEGRLLDKAAEIGAKVLSSGDALFLRKILSGDSPPVKDWRKLNRKATFKMKYEARSEEIERLLQTLLEDFSADVQQAKVTEEDAKTLHGKLMTTKGDQKDKAVTALSTLDKENGARSMSKTEAEEEKRALEKQVADDTTHISDVEAVVVTKTKEWEDRKELRQGELAAISQAISILHSDDARDTFKRSFESQGYLLLQQGRATSLATKRSAKWTAKQSAAAALLATARRSHDSRLEGLALLATTNHFDTVISAIDSMISELETEDTDELGKKEKCESDRATDTREAIKTSREIDDFSDTITGLKAKIEEVVAEIEAKEESIKIIDKQLAEADTLRQREHEDYLAAKKDDDDAVKLVSDAKTVLEEFYAGALLQRQRGRAGRIAQPFESTAGEAPPPPPPTWEAPYSGKKPENQGIVTILSIIKSDIQNDLAKAKTAEEGAAREYRTLKTDLDGDQQTLRTEISTLEGTKANHEGDVTTNKGDRSSKEAELKATMKKIKDAEDYCDFLSINWAARSHNRNLELVGLKQAKVILEGAVFPGDGNTTLLQLAMPHGF